MNRIDSRARGNAPQLLEKYKKLAHDAMLNGDRVQEEYYLQFADHYFRVIADQKQRQEEARQPRRDDRGQDNEDSDTSHDQGRERARRADGRADNGQDNRSSGDTSDSNESDNRARSVYEPADNPFVRDNRSAPKPRKSRRKDEGDEESSGGFDPSALPPSIASSDTDEGKAPGTEPAAEEKPAKRTRAKAKAPSDKNSAEKADADKPKATRARKSAAKPADDGDTPSDSADGEAKPRPRRRTTRKSAANEDAPTSAEAEA